MGQNSSHHDRSSKHRQSTRSLPDASMHRLDNEAAQWAAYANPHGLPSGKKTKESNGVCAKSGPGEGYEQNLANFQRNWQKAAAPYYAPSTDQAPQLGPRSLDGNLRRAYPESARTDRRIIVQNDEFDDRWSDVASDMYRLRKHASCRSSGSNSRIVRRDGRINEIIEAKSDCSAPSSKIYKSRRYKRGASSDVGVPLSLVPENPSDVQAIYRDNYFAPNQLDKKLSSTDGKKRSKSVQNFRTPDLTGLRPGPPPDGKPPRPPKKGHYYDRLENPNQEKWIDYPSRDSKVKFDASAAASSPSSDFSSPKSPTSSECDKLIIHSLRAELNAERSLRMEIERRSKKDTKEMESLRRTVGNLEKQTEILRESSFTGSNSKKKSDLEETCNQLSIRLKQMEEDKIRMEKDGQQQKSAYDRCLDDIADRVAQAVINQKTLKSECVRLQKRVFEMEWKNKILKSQLDSKSKSSQPSSSGAVTPTYGRFSAPSSGPTHQEIVQNTMSGNKWPNPKLEPIFRLTHASCESITSFGDQNLSILQPLAPTISPMSNGGEALCSRPTSFNFDAYANETLNKFEASTSSDGGSTSEIPKNFAEIYGEIDDPFQNSSLRQSTSMGLGFLTSLNDYGTPANQIRNPTTAAILPRSRPQTANLRELPGIRSSPARRRASVSDGSNDTLCPNQEGNESDSQPVNRTSPKREIIVNMVRNLTAEADFSRIFKNTSKLSELLTHTFADDGYSTMSSENYFEFIMNNSTKTFNLNQKYSIPIEKQLNSNGARSNLLFSSSFSDDLLWSSDFYSRSAATKGFKASKKFLSDTQLISFGSKSCRAKRLMRQFSRRADKSFVSFLPNEENYADFFCPLSSHNDLTEFERDMLIWQDDQAKGEAMFELDEETKVLIEQESPAVMEESKTEQNFVQMRSIQSGDIEEKENCSIQTKISTSKKLNSKTKRKPSCRREPLNDSSTTSSYTSDDSEDDGAATMQEWLKQLKIQKAKGKLAVVRYTPTDHRPSILRRDVFHRFGQHERKALTYFDFLYGHSSPCSPELPESNAKKFLEIKNCLRNGRIRGARPLDKRKSGSFSNAPTFQTNGDYENLPYHRLVRTLSADFQEKKLSADRWRRWKSSSSSSLDRFSRRSYGSSLFLSDLCVADRTLSSSSSLSFSNF